MKTEPSVSVVIPCYNSAAHLSHAVESVLAQTFEAFELLIVDDGSTDQTQDAIAPYLRDPRVRLLRLPENRGPSAARNAGVRESKASLIAFLDADDRWLPQMLERATAALANPDCDVCSVAAYRLRPDGTQSVIVQDSRIDRDELYQQLLFRNVLPASASGTMVRRECLNAVGLFDESLRAVEDRDLWVRLAEHYTFAFVNTPLAYYNRQRSDSAVGDRMRMALGRKGFLHNRERDVPARFRHLLPRLRRVTYRKLAQAYRARGDSWQCRKYCLLALGSFAAIDSEAIKAASMFLYSFTPSRLGTGHAAGQ